MKLLRLTVNKVSFDPMQEGGAVLFLEEKLNKKSLSVMISGSEAQSILIALNGKKKRGKQNIHDLFLDGFRNFQIKIEKIIIDRLKYGNLYCHLVCKSKDAEKTINAKLADAVAISIRSRAPLYISKDTFRRASFFLEQESFYESEDLETKKFKNIHKDSQLKKIQFLRLVDKDGLEEFLKKALQEEHYEFAALIKKEIDRRKIIK